MDYTILVMLMKDLVILPYQEIKIELKDEISKKIVKIANKKFANRILIVSPSGNELEPSIEDLPKIGVVSLIKSKLELSNGNLRLTLKGEKRVKICEYTSFSDDIISASVMDINLPKLEENEKEVVKKKLKDTLNEYIDASPNITNSIVSMIKDNEDLDFLTDAITTFLPLKPQKKMPYMIEANYEKRAINLIKDIKLEIKYLKLEEKIENRVEMRLSKEQEEYYLKEKLKEIESVLGIKDENENVKVYYDRLNELTLEKKTKEKLEGEIKKLERMSTSSPEKASLQSYLDWVLYLPWNISSKENLNAKKVMSSLNKSHYGLTKIKNRVIDYLNVKNLNNDIPSPIICLVGPPGVGKTTITKSIASSLNREFYKISVGGLNDSTELIGSRRTYLGALPGKIIEALKKCNTNNPVILIDEVDKMVKDFKGDPASTLLDILDSTQNKYFTDYYIEEPFDLSKVMFVLTANEISNIPYTLIDRLEVIELSSYNVYEKLDIAKKYLLPSIYNEFNLTKKLVIKDDTLMYLINNYTRESGVRNLKRVLRTLVTKVVSNKSSYTITTKSLSKYLEDLKEEVNINITTTGVVNALAYTPLGGITFKVECSIYEGKEEIIVTGSLGDVLKESVMVGLSYLKENNLISKDDVKDKTIHLHFLDASTKKEGPSCGVSIITAILSKIKNVLIDSKTTFTGEISLKGDILKVGGIKEKIIAAYNAGIKTIYIPTDNASDLKEIPKKILDKLEIKKVSKYSDIYKEIFKNNIA